jgi:hypothetical protein
MIYTARYVMLLMQANPLRGQVRRMPFGPKKVHMSIVSFMYMRVPGPIARVWGRVREHSAVIFFFTALFPSFGGK